MVVTKILQMKKKMFSHKNNTNYRAFFVFNIIQKLSMCDIPQNGNIHLQKLVKTIAIAYRTPQKGKM